MNRYFYLSTIVVLVIAAAVHCEKRTSSDWEALDGGPDTGADADTDADADGDVDGDSDSDGDTDGTVLSYIWVANSAEGTLSKVDTKTLVEVGRYRTSPVADSDPSRTSVNLEGDAVVTNRRPSEGPSSVTKFAAVEDRCVDRNSNGTIDTSSGPDDVKPWGEDECMLWNTELDPHGTGGQVGARATAWDGEDFLWIGTFQQHDNPSAQEYVFKVDGSTGEILERTKIPFGAYGGAVDGEGGFWIANSSPSGENAIARVDTTTLAVETHGVRGAYGICVDTDGRIWTTAGSRVVRFDPSTGDELESGAVPGLTWGRGIAIGVKDTPSEGSVWVAETLGRLIELDQATMTHKKTVRLETPGEFGGVATIGVAVDYEGYIWVVSRTANAAYKVDPSTYDHEMVAIGDSPYTYSDMTGMQLQNVDPIIE